MPARAPRDQVTTATFGMAVLKDWLHVAGLAATRGAGAAARFLVAPARALARCGGCGAAGAALILGLARSLRPRRSGYCVPVSILPSMTG